MKCLCLVKQVGCLSLPFLIMESIFFIFGDSRKSFSENSFCQQNDSSVESFMLGCDKDFHS